MDVWATREGPPQAEIQWGADAAYSLGKAAMMYDRGQSDMWRALLHLVEHGVTLDFALCIFATPREDMWWPTRGELVAGGVIMKEN